MIYKKKTFIVDNCTIFLIVRTIVSISVLCPEMASLSLRALKRDLVYFYRRRTLGLCHAFFSLNSSHHFHIQHNWCCTYRIQMQPMNFFFLKPPFSVL